MEHILNGVMLLLKMGCKVCGCGAWAGAVCSGAWWDVHGKVNVHNRDAAGGMQLRPVCWLECAR